MGGGSDAADAEFVVISASVVVAGSAVVVCASFASLVLPPPLVSFFLHGVHGSKLKRLLSVAMSAEISPSTFCLAAFFWTTCNCDYL
jgi:hypothetical protein